MTDYTNGQIRQAAVDVLGAVVQQPGEGDIFPDWWLAMALFEKVIRHSTDELSPLQPYVHLLSHKDEIVWAHDYRSLPPWDNCSPMLGINPRNVTIACLLALGELK